MTTFQQLFMSDQGSTSSSKTVVVFDLDGTLADIGHRLWMIYEPEPDYEAFYQECFKDELFPNVAQMLRVFKRAGYFIIIASGRGESVREMTLQWLEQHDIMPHKLLMRAKGDTRPDLQVKSEWLKNNDIPKDRVLCVIEDRKHMVELWRKKGLTALQVNFGDY